jgi:hypothetical protein
MENKKINKCQICTKTNHHPNGLVAVVTTFPQKYFAEIVLSHVIYLQHKNLAKDYCKICDKIAIMPYYD